MSTIKGRQPAGSLKISQEVIATIASRATNEVEGVDSLVQPGNRGSAWNKLFGKKPVQITLSDDFAQIDISVCLKYGAQIVQVCTEIQDSVKDNIQTMTGMAVSKVNVLVSGIAFPGEPEEA